MSRLRTVPLGFLAGACALSFSGVVTLALSGCGDETTQTGTLAPFDAEKQKIGQDKMREFMAKKAQSGKKK